MTHLKEGDKAPHFRGIDQNGNTIDSNDYAGKKLILYFYPKDDTPGCTAEACNLRDNHDDLIGKGFMVVGVSSDDQKSHMKFAGKYELPFSLIADTTKQIQMDYGVFGPKKFMGRSFDGTHRVSFVIDEEGTILKIFTKVETKDHSAQILGSM